METFKYQTASRSILADLYTPVGTYMRLRDLYPQSALMESSDYHEAGNSRSYIGIRPMASVAIAHGTATVNYQITWLAITLHPFSKGLGNDRLQQSSQLLHRMRLYGYAQTD
jgi:hypothetical protein